MMTPITHYVIYFGRDRGSLTNYTTANAQTTQYTMRDWTGRRGEWLVGVASANSAGLSPTSYEEISEFCSDTLRLYVCLLSVDDYSGHN